MGRQGGAGSAGRRLSVAGERPSVAAVYLLWAPLGTEPVRRFAASYAAHPAGRDHRLVVVANGLPDDGAARERELARLRAPLGAIQHDLLETPGAMLDLPAYAHAASRLQESTVCLLNSYSEIRADGWLGLLADALAPDDVGLAGASGSWESQSEWIRGPARYWLYQLALLPRARRDFPRFPNPHLRTTGLLLERELAVGLAGPGADKLETYRVESGRESLTRRVLGAGRRAVVVGRDGSVRDVPEWPLSGTYRAAGQRNLLISDRRTQDWEEASPRLRARLGRDAWGRAAR